MYPTRHDLTPPKLQPSEALLQTELSDFEYEELTGLEEFRLLDPIQNFEEFHIPEFRDLLDPPGNVKPLGKVTDERSPVESLTPMVGVQQCVAEQIGLPSELTTTETTSAPLLSRRQRVTTARVARRVLKDALSAASGPTVSVRFGAEPSATCEISRDALLGLAKILRLTAKERPSAVTALNDDLTTEQAADLLKMSRTKVLGLIARKELPCRYVGKHRRLKRKDVLAQRGRRRSLAPRLPPGGMLGDLHMMMSILGRSNP